jgi:hypothetical protein
VNGNDWINDFVERLTNIEGIFEIYVSLFLKYNHQFVFGLKGSKEWIEEQGKRKVAISAIGGRVDWSKDKNLIQILKERCAQDIGIEVTIEDSPYTYLDYQHRLKKIPIDLVRGKTRPHMVTFIQKSRYSTVPGMLIFSFTGNTQQKPQALQYSALFLAGESVLVQMFKSEKTVKELKQAGATFEERIQIPDSLLLYPTGSINSLLRFLSYEVF